MLKRLATALLLAAFTTGCGTALPATGVKAKTGAVKALDEGDHEQMNAIVRGVLKAHMPQLLAGADADKDGAISRAEYAPGRSAQVQQTFFEAFDTSKDGKVAGAEFDAAIAKDAGVEAFHHHVEAAMEAKVKPYMAGDGFDMEDLRAYMTRDLGLTADWPLLFSLMEKMDLNADEKLLNSKGEGPAFMLTFAGPQLQRELAMPPVLGGALKRRK